MRARFLYLRSLCIRMAFRLRVATRLPSRSLVGSGLLRLAKHVLRKVTALLSPKGTIWRLPPLPKD